MFLTLLTEILVFYGDLILVFRCKLYLKTVKAAHPSIGKFVREPAFIKPELCNTTFFKPHPKETLSFV